MVVVVFILRSLSMEVSDVMCRPNACGSVWARTFCVIAAIGIALVACKPTAKVPLSGRVSLEYSSTSESNILFSLANGSSQPIGFRGWSAVLTDTTPIYSGECDDPRRAVSTTIVGPARDRSRPKIVEVSPGMLLRLAIPSDDFRQYKGSRCRLTLRLEDGSMVQSTEFNP